MYGEDQNWTRHCPGVLSLIRETGVNKATMLVGVKPQSETVPRRKQRCLSWTGDQSGDESWAES